MRSRNRATPPIHRVFSIELRKHELVASGVLLLQFEAQLESWNGDGLAARVRRCIGEFTARHVFVSLESVHALSSEDASVLIAALREQHAVTLFGLAPLVRDEIDTLASVRQ